MRSFGRISPLLEALSPLPPKPFTHFCRQLREAVLLVPRKRTQVFAQNRFDRCKVGEIEAIVKRPELTDRVPLQLFKPHLVEMTGRDQGTLLEECFEDLLVLADDAVVQVGFVWPLQAPPWPGLSHHVLG